MDFGMGMLKVFNKYADAYMRIFKTESDYDERQCGACPYDHNCCNMLVFTTPFEVAAINVFINRVLPPRIIKVVQKAIKRRAGAVKRHFARYGDESEAVEAWFSRSEMCLFYNKRERKCDIYQVRPMACRKIWSVRDCGKLEWATRLDRSEVLKHRIEMLPHYDLYEENVAEMSIMLVGMMGEQYTRVGLEFRRLLDDRTTMDDLDIINPVEKKKGEGVDSELLV